MPPSEPNCVQVRKGLASIETRLMQTAQEIRDLASLLPECEISRRVILAAWAFDIERAADGLRNNRLDMRDWKF